MSIRTKRWHFALKCCVFSNWLNWIWWSPWKIIRRERILLICQTRRLWLMRERLQVGTDTRSTRRILDSFLALFLIDMSLFKETDVLNYHSLKKETLTNPLLWSSGKGQARMGKGWPISWKASKLKPLPRAYIKVGCHHHPPPKV